METFISILSLAAICSTSMTAMASDLVIIPGHQCVKASISQVVEAVTNYRGFYNAPEAEMSYGPFKVMRMLTSQESPKVVGSHEDSIVYFELVPLNLGQDKKSVFPRFMIRCQLSRPTADTVHHDCHWLTAGDLSDYGRPGNPPEAFGLSDFSSTLSAVARGSCGPDQTEVNFEVRVQPKSEDVAKIQQAAGFGRFPIPENEFFKAYFENFYNGWLKRIGS